MKRSRMTRYAVLAGAILLLCGTLRGQNGQTVVTGAVLDSVSRAPLRGVTIRALDTRFGAITSTTGRFLLRLPPGSYTLAFSMVGYRTEQRAITVGPDSATCDMMLAAAPYQLEAVVISAEDPGVKLMRGAIARKLRQRDSLRTYSYMLYTRFVASTDTLTAGRSGDAGDTTIVSIFESYSRGYYRSPESYFNEIIQRRQSANIPPQSNLVAFGTNLNAYDDYVTILGEQIATPFHPDAIGYYDFVLEGTARADDSTRISRITVTPKGNARRLFEGYVDIDPDRLVPLSVDLRPNRAVRLPFDAELRYDQQFEIVDGRFVLPTSMHIYSSLLAELFWIIAPRLDITIETVAYDYLANIQLDDGLFEQRRVELNAQADVFDSSYWSEHAVLPLRPEEERAYDNIRRTVENPDSAAGTGLFDRIFGPVTRTIGRLNRPPFTGFEDIARYNRVHGVYLGMGLRGDIVPELEATASAGYGFSDHHPYGELHLRSFLDTARRVSFGAGIYRRLERRDNPHVVTALAITLGSLLAKNDYGDYYYVDGFETSVEAGFGQLQFIRRDLFERPTRIRLFARSEEHRSAPNTTEFALLGGNGAFRDNPPIVEGRLRSVGFALNLNYHPRRRLGNFGAQVTAEIANPDLLGGDFRFEQYRGALQLRTRTLPLWRLDLRLSGGFSRGRVPAQRFFSLESAFSSTASEGAFRGMRVKEFYGDRFAALSLEHNFGEVIPGVLRIPNIASFGIEFIALANIGWTGFSRDALFASHEGSIYDLPSTDATSDRMYYEIGAGLNRVLIFFRTDVTVRLSQTETPRFFFTISSTGF